MHVKVYFFIYFFYFILGTTVCCHFDKSNDKNPDKIKIFTDDYYIPNIKVKIMLYEPFFVKCGLKIYREVWKFESGKVWNFEMENV